MKKRIALLLALVLCLGLCACGISAKKAAEINQAAIGSLASAQVGDEISFGVYEKKPIKWNVVDVQDGLYLLVAATNVTLLPYHNEGGSADSSSPLYHANEWSDCTLRKWLNSEFYEAAFDDVAKAAIVTCSLDNSISEGGDKSGGSNTEDNVFILSYAECEKYLEPLDLLKVEEEEGFWLRNPAGTNGLFAAICSADYLTPEVGAYGSGSSEVGEPVGVRPAIRVTDSGAKSVSLSVGPATEPPPPLDLSDSGSSSGSSGSDDGTKCAVCNGTGYVRYYYGDSDWEAILSGHDPYTTGPCTSCGGTGRAD